VLVNGENGYVAQHWLKCNYRLGVDNYYSNEREIFQIRLESLMNIIKKEDFEAGIYFWSFRKTWNIFLPASENLATSKNLFKMKTKKNSRSTIQK